MLLQPLLISKKTWDTLTGAKVGLRGCSNPQRRFFDARSASLYVAIETYTTAGVKVRPDLGRLWRWIKLALRRLGRIRSQKRRCKAL